MAIRRPTTVAFLVLIASSASSWRAQEAVPDSPRALVYSAPLLRGARLAAMDVDASGRIYLAGYICESTLPVTANAAQSAYRGGCDGFVAIIAPDGRLEYASYLGGSQQERIWTIDADASGNVYVGGDTSSSNFPTTAGAFDVTCGATGDCSTSGRLDGFVTKIAPSGALVYSTFLGGSDSEFVLGVAVDSSGRAHLAGYTRSVDFPTTAGAVSASYQQHEDAFYTRLDASGAAVSYSTYISGEGSEYAAAVALDAAGAAYITGATESANFPTVMALQPALRGASDAWLMKIAADRTVKYISYFGGSAHDAGNDLAIQGSSVFVAGSTCSTDLPMAAPRATTCGAGFVTKIAADGTAVQKTAVVEGTSGRAVGVDAQHRAFLLGNGGDGSFAPTPDSFQPAPGPLGSASLAVVSFGGTGAPEVTYASYVGAGGPGAEAVRIDGAGGVYLGLQFNNDEGHAAFPVVNAPFYSVPGGSGVMHFVPESRMVDNVAGELVMYAEDVTRIAGNWQIEIDPFAAMGRKLRNPNNGAAKVSSPAATPADYVEFQFYAQAGVNYRLWLRGRADNDNWANDSVFVQFSDSVDSGGAAVWRIGSPGGTAVNLEDCSGCGIKGWGWQDNGYGAGVLGTPVRFAADGTHTLRVQRREDGFAFDQIVLSSSRYFTSAPGPLKAASTVLPRSNGQSAPAGISEVVLHMTAAETHGAWVKQTRTDAAHGIVVRHPDAGAPKVTVMPVPAVNYFELAFDAEAGRPYHLWVRGIADRDYWGNDSVHVQFSDSLDASGAARWRIGTSSSAEVNLEDCSGCGLRGWGWQDNGWGVGVNGPPIYFASTGRHVIRVTTREDGFNIDQIVLSSGRYLTSSPGTLKSDTTILPNTQ
jgi:hypothetical protein